MTGSDRLRSKYHVRRIDGRDRVGGDRYDAAYFVLDYVHDPYARQALLAYADACEPDLPGLARDLRDRLRATRGLAELPPPKTRTVHPFRPDPQGITGNCVWTPPSWAENAGHCGLPEEAHLPRPGDPAYDPDVHVTAAAQRAREQAGREDH